VTATTPWVPESERCPICRGKGGRNKRCRACQHVAWKPCACCNGTGRLDDASPAYAARHLRRGLYEFHMYERLLSSPATDPDQRREGTAFLREQYEILRRVVESWRKRLEPEVFDALFGDITVAPLRTLDGGD
jgi:hypothetical protein